MIRTLAMKPRLKIQPLALAVLTAAFLLAGCKESANTNGKPAADEVSTALNAGEKAARPDPLVVSAAPDFGTALKVVPAGVC